MPSDRWQQVERIFSEAVGQPPPDRREFLARQCAGNAALHEEITSLLNAADQSGHFLSATALEAFALQISREGWSVKTGDRVASYTIERRLGSGGMGEVWRARDDRLERDVAIKFLLPHASNHDERVRAFQREARAAGTLNHTNVLTVYDLGEHNGAPYLVTEYLEGQSLRARLRAGPLPRAVALDIALQVARGLSSAHARGIVHRDLKPENLFMARDGRVKILDFGLATLRDTTVLTKGFVAGTAGYMAPEQVRGDDVDARADIFSLGAVLREMLTRDLPPAVAAIVTRCLAEDRDTRFATTADLESALVRALRTEQSSPLLGFFRRPFGLSILLLVVLALAAAGWRWRVATTGSQWARTVAAPEIDRLSGRGDVTAAFLLAREALSRAPDDPHLRQLWLDLSIPAAVTTDPPGADVEFKPYASADAKWYPLGRTPIADVRVPRSMFRVRVVRAGYAPIEGTATAPVIFYRLDRLEAVPPGMVRVDGAESSIRLGLEGGVGDFWMDRFEVTNRQFKEFVDRGGYRRPEFWREAFVEGGRSLSWEEAIARFRDASGRPGPSTWSLGTFPKGQEDFPVGGVSWYEAAAYAAFAGKSLPTVHHWFRAARLGRYADILKVSNFSGTGATAVGARDGLGPYGTYDMAGNAKEWVWNQTGDRRFSLGGGWNEPRYMFADYDAKLPFERGPAYGIRLAKYDRPVAPDITGPIRIDALDRDARAEHPVDDAIFDVFRRQYAYDSGPLNAAVEGIRDEHLWSRETIAFDAAYGHERVRAHLFIPKNATPPYQTVIFFPAADAFRLTSSEDLSLLFAEVILHSGRALLYPVYKGSYERRSADPLGANAQRDLRVAWSRDFGRAIDYLETRSDIDRNRLAYYGVSAGGDIGVILTALDSRVKASILQGAGIWTTWLPEFDPLNYASRVRVPTLMINGRYDFENPFETAQQSLFTLLGTPGTDKRHAVFEAGHALPVEDVAREALPWLDRYLGRPNLVLSQRLNRIDASSTSSR